MPGKSSNLNEKLCIINFVDNMMMKSYKGQHMASSHFTLYNKMYEMDDEEVGKNDDKKDIRIYAEQLQDGKL
jgi:hypothetical protein